MKIVRLAASSPLVVVIMTTIIRMKTVAMIYNTNCVLSMNSSLLFTCRHVSICNFWSFLGALFLLSNDEGGEREFVNPTFIVTVLLCAPSSILGMSGEVSVSSAAVYYKMGGNILQELFKQMRSLDALSASMVRPML